MGVHPLLTESIRNESRIVIAALIGFGGVLQFLTQLVVVQEELVMIMNCLSDSRVPFHLKDLDLELVIFFALLLLLLANIVHFFIY